MKTARRSAVMRGSASIALALVVSISACSSASEGVDTGNAEDDASGASPAAGAAQTSDDQLVWADGLIRALTDLERSQTEFRRTGELWQGTPDAELRRLADQAAAFDELADGLPGAPPSGDLLVSRYAQFDEGLTALRDAALAVSVPPADGAPWRFAESMVRYERAEEDFVAACFGLQEALDRAQLGPIGCAGLAEVDDDARAFFDLMADEGLQLLPMVAADEGFDLGVAEFGVAADRPVIRCMNQARDPVGLAQIDSIAAATRTARLDRGDDIITLEVWAFADAATKDAVEAVLGALVQSDKECLSGAGPLFSSIWTTFNSDLQDYGPAEAFVTIPGFQQPAIQTADGPAFTQFSWATFQNVLALYSSAGRGELLTESEIGALVNQITIGGDRRPA